MEKNVNKMTSGQKQFTVYRASAGSGKTFTLVREYLTLAMAGSDDQIRDNFRHILAITFTNKSTNEMKERILDYLADMQDPAIRDDKEKGRGMRDALCDTLGGISPDELSRRAEVLQKAILHKYSDFSVCTIDSFMSRIVRTFAVDLGLSPRFEISLDGEVLLDGVVDKLFADISDQHSELTKIIIKFASSKMEDGKSFNVYRDVRTASDIILKENILEKLSVLQDVSLQQFCDYAEALQKANREYETMVREDAKKICKDIVDNGLTDDDFVQKKNGLFGYFRKIAGGDFGNIKGTATVINIVESGNIAHKDSKNKTLVDLLAPSMKKTFEKNRCGNRAYLSRKALLANVFQMALLKDLSDKMAEYYTENEMLHISENNKRVSEEVKNEDAPFIFERLGCRYKHFLIDEFQDTSIMQWQNLLPLVVNGLSEGHRSLIVGDGKQAIYRFRQGDVEQFQNIASAPAGAAQTVKDHYKAIAANCKIEELDTNYRSAGNIVDFNNRFFTFLEQQLQQMSPNQLMHDIYIGTDPDQPSLAQKVKESKKGKGYVELDFIQKDVFADEAPQRIYNILCHLKEVGYDYKNVAILSRFNDKLSQLNLDLLEINSREKRLPNLQFASADSLKLSQNADCKFLRSMMHFVHDNNNAIAKLEIAEYLYAKGAEEFDSNIFATQGQFEQTLAEKYTDYNRDRLLSQTLYDCACNLVRIFQIPKTQYVYTFLNKVEEYAENNRTDIGNFLEWLDNVWKKLSTVTSDQLDAISLMSIHKSKGLEFAVVIYYMATKKERTETIWVNVDNKSLGIEETDYEPIKVGMVVKKKELDETDFEADYAAEKAMSDIDKLNLMYVAMTRPKSQLYVVAETASKKEDGKKSKKGEAKAPTSHTELLENYLKRDGSEFDHCQLKNIQETEIGTRYYLGDSRKPQDGSKVAETKQPVPLPLSANQSNPWTDRITIVGRSNNIMQPKTNEQTVGDMVHDILSKIGTLDHVQAATDDYLNEHKPENDVAQKVRSLIHSILNSENVKAFFKPDYEYKTECDIMHRGEIVRPDRIVFADGETWVVDFKTGSHVKKYNEQVRGYMSVLEEMGYEKVKGFLLYISDEGCEVEEV